MQMYELVRCLQDFFLFTNQVLLSPDLFSKCTFLRCAWDPSWTDHTVFQVGYKKNIWIKLKLKLKLLGVGGEVGDPAQKKQTDMHGRGMVQGGGAAAQRT